MTRVYIYLFVLFCGILFSLQAYAQCPIVDFDIPASVCQNELFKIKNNSTNSTENRWDFCSGDIGGVPSKSGSLVNSLFDKPSKITFVNDDGKWYGFIASRFGKRILRLDYGSDLNSSPVVVDLGKFNNIFSQPVDIVFYAEDNKWYALVLDLGANKLFRIAFSSITDEKAVVTELENFNALMLLNTPTDIAIINDAGNITAFISNYTGVTLTKVLFGSSITNNPTGTNYPIAGGSNLQGISVEKVCDKLNILITSEGNNKIYKVEYLNGLNSNPSLTEVPIGGQISRPVGISILEENAVFYAFIHSFSGNLYRISHPFSPTTSISNLGAFTASNSANQGVTIVESNSKWFGFLVNINANSVDRIIFPNVCGIESFAKSSEVNPIVSYAQSGVYNITLTATDGSGNISSKTKEIIVLDQQAPQIQVQQGENQCLSNPIILSSENLTPDQTIASYLWNFPDGSQQTTTEASHQFTQPGTYKVLLNIESENGCGNYYEKEVIVYPEPQAAYELSATLACTNTGITFTNLTGFPEESVITYSWDFGDGTTSAEKSPVHEFGTAGTYAVILEASIPGCATTSTQYIEVQSGPKTLFEAQPVCDQQKVVFANRTTGENITEFEWDLGDGTTSTLESPEHIYDEKGSYIVVLKSANALGCVSSYTQTVRIYSNPVADFTFTAACEGVENPVLFTDTSTDADGNFTEWLWEFEMPDGSVTTSTTQNTSVSYPQAGTYGVTLTAKTNWGCERMVRKMVEVVAVPEVTIGLEGGCLETPSRLTDLSETLGVKVQSRLWMIKDKVFTDSAFSYTFPEAGVYEVVLQINLENGCSVRDTLPVEINPLPEVKFTAKGTCQGQMATFSALTPAEEYIWNIDGKVITGEGPQIQYMFKEAGKHTVSLTVQDERGCSNIITKEFDAGQPPVAAFSADRYKGVPPFEVSFTNESQDGATYLWLFGDAQGSRSILENPVFTFSEIRDYEVQLITYNAAGCADTASQLISVLAPNYDVVLTSVNLLRQNNQTLVVAGLENAGTIRVTDMDIEVLINNEYAITEKFEGGLEIGQKENYTLKTQLNENGKRPIRFICVELKPVLTLVTQELSTENNKRCPSFDQAFVMQEPFPNPGQDMVRLEFLLPEPGTVTITVYTAHGKLVEQAELKNMKAELNQAELPIHHLGKGIYFLRARFGSEEVNFRIMKN